MNTTSPVAVATAVPNTGDTAASERLIDMLGLTPDEFAVYRLIVGVGAITPEGLQSALELTTDQVASAIRRLTTSGLVRSGHGQVLAVDPATALRPRLAELTTAAQALSTLTSQLSEDFYASRRRQEPVRLLEVITGSTTLRGTLEAVQQQARHEMLWLCKANAVALPSEANTAELRALDRGVPYRVIYERPLLTEPGMVANIAAGIERGEQARVLPSLPVRLAVADRSTAVLPLTTTVARGQEPTAAVVHDSVLCQVLVALFEELWERATPLGRISATDVTEGPDLLDLHPEDRYLLSLVVSGVPDKAIASQLGVSLRTVQRRVSTLMVSMNVETRVELAYLLGRRRALS
ncbi:LuxR C-terminal-related transcriptional regulator [Nocardioides sp. MAHUQ-72]|uniref:LuxR C-terminal-related transcriptional regulator n=1 Tax=unclassified Nocardioides TaxID=2615069 RepID=UPI00361439E2